MKRLLTQIGFFLVTNLNLGGFVTGHIYRGPLKNVCVPGLNCYSCPGALGACPIGALQAVVGGAKHQVSFYVMGLLALFGVLMGRFVCGWLCPFGLVQDLLGRLKRRKWQLSARIDRPLRWLKYGVLAVFVVLLPMWLTNAFGIAPPYFCQYICPSGALFGGVPLLLTTESLRGAIGLLFGWKAALLALFLGLSLVIDRPFCKYVCPLGAVYALFNRVSFVHLAVDGHRCVRCGRCAAVCPMQVPMPEKPNHAECIRCGRCAQACTDEAIQMTPIVPCSRQPRPD